MKKKKFNLFFETSAVQGTNIEIVTKIISLIKIFSLLY
jgi:hypothetical protein